MRMMRNLRGMLVAFVLIALGLRVMWWSLAPLVPIAIIIVVILMAFGLLLRRFWD